MARDQFVEPARTSWGAAIDGWLATVGVAAILTPIVGMLLANVYTQTSYAATVPVLVAVGVSYLVGGYVAGRMAGYRTSWHGMMCAFFGLFVVLALLIVGIAMAAGVFGTSGTLVELLPAVLGVSLYRAAETFAFGGALSLLIAIFAGWLGGLLAPARVVPAVPVATAPAAPAPAAPVVEERRTQTEVRHPMRERFRLLPAAGRKGGERVDEVEERERVERP